MQQNSLKIVAMMHNKCFDCRFGSTDSVLNKLARFEQTSVLSMNNKLDKSLRAFLYFSVVLSLVRKTQFHGVTRARVVK